jgi:tetratricopeptide (TPR) repeat protein
MIFSSTFTKICLTTIQMLSLLNIGISKNKKMPAILSSKILTFVILFTLIIACSETKQSKVLKDANDSLSKIEAVKDISKSIESDPENPELFYQRAQIYVNEKLLNRAEDDYREAARLDSTNPLYAYSLARTLYAMNLTKESAQWYEKAIQIKPDYGEAIVKLADLYFLVKEHQKSINLLNEFRKVNPGEAYIYHMLGLNYKELGDTGRAIYHFQTAIENDPKDYESTLYVANLYAGKKKLIANEYFLAALKIKPKGIDALFGRAVFNQQLRNYKSALMDYRKIIDLDPQNYLAYYNVGYINYDNGFMDEALRNWNICSQMNPNYANAFYMKGLVYEEQKLKQEARIQYQVAADLDPENTLFKAGLNRLN